MFFLGGFASQFFCRNRLYSGKDMGGRYVLLFLAQLSLQLAFDPEECRLLGFFENFGFSSLPVKEE